jgi:hypothetical protein
MPHSHIKQQGYGYEYGSWRIYIVGSHYEAMTSEVKQILYVLQDCDF